MIEYAQEILARLATELQPLVPAIAMTVSASILLIAVPDNIITMSRVMVNYLRGLRERTSSRKRQWQRAIANFIPWRMTSSKNMV
ncbi:hypothetical protein GJ744_005908 [Endocarpon pusillum]|uniref:Uncharacterized protein n=1 Tax=Endocarpon pusillum TaxID=364733 RepID=A0A8H7E784_9EURO|nr:hypothetical protein GJ744_005908 [Endocarpon pusillum]